MNPPSRTPLVPASIGDIVDRLTILELKAVHIDAEDPRLAHVRHERDGLRGALQDQCGFDLDELFADETVRELADVNAGLWDVEDDIRRCLANEDFGDEFVKLARRVPELNDRRSALKYQLNSRLGSDIVEVKSYVGFELGEPG